MAAAPRPPHGPTLLLCVGTRPFQAVAASVQPLVVVSTAQADDWDESSSFLTERLLQALPLSGTDLMSAETGVSSGCPQQLYLQSQDRPPTRSCQPCPSQPTCLPGKWEARTRFGSWLRSCHEGAALRSGAANLKAKRGW